MDILLLHSGLKAAISSKQKTEHRKEDTLTLPLIQKITNGVNGYRPEYAIITSY